MTKEAAIAELSSLNALDPDRAHSRADDILLAYLSNNGADDLAEAYLALIDRCPWWACA